jgi:hypothetical protein
MKKLGLLGIVLLFTLNLIGCTSSHPEYYQSQQMDQGEEAWMQQVNLNPNQWTVNADPWYFSNDIDVITRKPVFDPVAQEMATTPINIPFFNNVNVEGNYRVQIVGKQIRNGISIIGTPYEKSQVTAEIRNETLYIHPNQNCKKSSDKKCLALSNVIIRVGVGNLRNLTSHGNNIIIGKDIYSDKLIINATDHSNILMRGEMRLNEVNTSGSATVTVLGANTPCLNIVVNGGGTVNVAGRVGVQSISNSGSGNVNIIGAYSCTLAISAKGASITKVAGITNLRSVVASDSSRVYVYWVNSKNISVKTCDGACVGIAGRVYNLNVETSGSSGFLGKCLQAASVYVKTFGSSHVNIVASKKIFAEASGNSSIYYFGSPSIISRFISGNATIIPVWTNEIATPPVSDVEPSMLPAKPQSQSYTW